jgi:hypothetical protein
MGDDTYENWACNEWLEYEYQSKGMESAKSNSCPFCRQNNMPFYLFVTS